MKLEEIANQFPHLDPDLLAGYFARHQPLCPGGNAEGNHEAPVARLYSGEPRPFLMTGRMDAIWTHDGLLDARDYKTGRVQSERTSEDWLARVQAWLLEPLAREKNLRLKVRHEYLAAEVRQQPEPFEPEDEDLDETGQWISQIADEIYNSNFDATDQVAVCARCEYSESCPESKILDDDDTITII